MPSKTKNEIVSAFLELIEREDFDRITVTDLVEMCDISRQTFYYHFDDIDQMLCYAFERETVKIYAAHEAENWTDYGEDYVSFFNRYDLLMRKAMKTTSFVLIYNLINNSFATCLRVYFEQKKGSQFASAKSTDYLINLLSGAFTAQIVNELQKDESNYDEMFSKLGTALTGYTAV
ncbi:MAG: TetR family transcriptional regulator [Eubacterium sp.]|nr:TetR family transcriptional regulator [Eubacterium sp.]